MRIWDLAIIIIFQWCWWWSFVYREVQGLFSQYGIWSKLQNVNLESEAWQRAEFWSDSGELPCPSPAGAMLLSRVFRVKPVKYVFRNLSIIPLPSRGRSFLWCLGLALGTQFGFPFFGFSPLICNVYMWAVTDDTKIPWGVIANSSEVQSMGSDPFKASRKKTEFYKSCKNCTLLFKLCCRDMNSIRHCYSLFSWSVQLLGY